MLNIETSAEGHVGQIQPERCADISRVMTYFGALSLSIMSLSLFACSDKNSEFIEPVSPNKNPDLPPISASVKSPPKRIFVTEGIYQGFLVNDQLLCQYSAGAGDMRGNWVPWISIIDSRPVSAIDRVQDVGPWYDLKGTLIFNHREDLKAAPLSPLYIDQYGKEVALGEPVWTGTLPGGALSDNFCFDNRAYRVWHAPTQDVQGDAGRVGMTDSTWTLADALPCTEKAHIICIEQ